MIKKILILFLFLSCSHIGSISQTSIPKYRGNKVTVEKSKNVIFMLSFDNDYIDDVVSELEGKCPGGSIKGIYTKDERVTYFPVVWHAYKLTVEGYCQKKIGRSK